MISYKKGYKYQLSQWYCLQTSIYPERHIMSQYIQLTTKGMLIIREGYAWDGPSGPTIDTRNFMRGSLVHDALYQLIRYKHLDPFNRLAVDELLRAVCLEDGMCGLRAWWVFRAVRHFGAAAARPSAN